MRLQVRAEVMASQADVVGVEDVRQLSVVEGSNFGCRDPSALAQEEVVVKPEPVFTRRDF